MIFHGAYVIAPELQVDFLARSKWVCVFHYIV